MTEHGGGTSSHHFCPTGTPPQTGNFTPLPTGLLKTSNHLHCDLRHFLPYFSSSSLFSQDQICMALWRLSLPSPASPSPPFIFHSYCPPNKPLTPNSNCELLTSPSASWSLQIDDTGGNYWWEDLCMFLSSCLVFEKLKIPTSSNVQHTTNFVLNTEHKRIYL